MCQAAPGHFALGIGTSSDVIVERWNGLTFDKPYQRVRDTIRFLRTALTGEKVDEQYETFRVRGFRLGIPVPEQPPILVAALREGMLRLAGRDGDGAERGELKLRAKQLIAERWEHHATATCGRGRVGDLSNQRDVGFVDRDHDYFRVGAGRRRPPLPA